MPHNKCHTANVPKSSATAYQILLIVNSVVLYIIAVRTAELFADGITTTEPSYQIHTTTHPSKRAIAAESQQYHTQLANKYYIIVSYTHYFYACFEGKIQSEKSTPQLVFGAFVRLYIPTTENIHRNLYE